MNSNGTFDNLGFKFKKYVLLFKGTLIYNISYINFK